MKTNTLSNLNSTEGGKIIQFPFEATQIGKMALVTDEDMIRSVKDTFAIELEKICINLFDGEKGISPKTQTRINR